MWQTSPEDSDTQPNLLEKTVAARLRRDVANIEPEERLVVTQT